MKLKIIFTLIIILLISQLNVNAKILRVGRIGAGVGGTDFGDLQSAVNNASTTVLDTIMLYPGDWSANISKKVVVLGPGYFIGGAGSNVGLQNISGSVSAFLKLYGGADSSIYEGIDNIDLRCYSGSSNLNKVITRRCRGDITVGSALCDSWKISQCYIGYLRRRSWFTSWSNG